MTLGLKFYNGFFSLFQNQLYAGCWGKEKAHVFHTCHVVCNELVE